MVIPHHLARLLEDDCYLMFWLCRIAASQQILIVINLGIPDIDSLIQIDITIIIL